jgi:twitching motility protein PilI
VNESARSAPGAAGGDFLDALRTLERRSAAAAAALPQPEQVVDRWAGVLFRVGETALLAPLDEVAEVLDVPREITSVPATKPWLCGLANNRGALLPIFDLQAFLFGVATARNARNRVLVARQDEFPFGLLVRDLVGIRHFEAATLGRADAGLRDLLGPLVSGCFRSEGESSPVFSVRRLAQDTRFNLAAA